MPVTEKPVAALTGVGRAWADAHRDLNLMAEVALDPSGWPHGFVRLARSYANACGVEREARRLFTVLVADRPGELLAALQAVA